MFTFGDYIIYVDESGDHGLASLDPEYPIFVLAFCIFRKADYAYLVVPRVQQFKFRWFGHDIIVLHEHEIRRRERPFVFLGIPEKREQFMEELSVLMAEAPMTIIASIIRKDRLTTSYRYANNPYELALFFCMERTAEFMMAADQQRRLTYVICESRGGSGQTEDRDLELEFRPIVAGAHDLRRTPIEGFDIVFADKKINSAGLQIADLLVRPIGLHNLRPGQPNRAFEIIAPKLCSLKVFP